MLFKKQDTFTNEFQDYSCVVKYSDENASFVFKQSLWYIFHFNEIEFYDDLMWCGTPDKALVQTYSNGANDGLVDARSNDITLTLIGKAILFPVGDGAGPYGTGLVYGNMGGQLKIISNNPVYTNLRGIPIVGKYADWSHTEFSKHVASVLNATLNSNLSLQLPEFSILSEKTGIKSGQFIL